jgi:hypothetical protein
MIIDGLLQFTGTPGAINPDLPTTGTQTSTNVIDLVSARDMGIGDNPALKLLVEIMTTFTGGTSLAVALQGAPDNGSGAPGTYTTMWTSPVTLEADLVAGRYLANVDMPRTVLPSASGPSAAQPLPRFLRLQYTTAGTHTAGSLYGSIVLDRQDYVSYPAGLTIPN